MVLFSSPKRESPGNGKMVRANGEAIYGTRPFVTYGEGPKALKGVAICRNDW